MKGFHEEGLVLVPSISSWLLPAVITIMQSLAVSINSWYFGKLIIWIFLLPCFEKPLCLAYYIGILWIHTYFVLVDSKKSPWTCIAKYKLMVEQEIAKLGGYEIIDGKLTLALNMIFVVQFIPSVPFHYMYF